MGPNLGDIIDDFCVKCKRIMNHAVVSVLNGQPAKVRCRICYSDHDYRHEQAPPPRIDPRKLAVMAAAGASAPRSEAGELPGTVDAPPGVLEAVEGVSTEATASTAAARENIPTSAVPKTPESKLQESTKPRGRKAKA